MNFQELRIAYLQMDYQDFTNKILDNLQDGLKKTDAAELQTQADHEDYLHLLNSFRSSIAANDRRHGANFMKQITSMLSTGEDGVYINGLRYIFELIQNVDDCMFFDHTNCFLNIYFNEADGRIVLSYNETGFTPFNVFAVTGIAEASKNISDGNTQIGEKGIGFKSVFGVAHRVWIQSGKFSFELDSKDFCVPIPVYGSRYEEVHGTKLTLFMEPSKVREAYKEICNKYHQSNAVFQNNPILFLNKLTRICFYNNTNDSLTFSVTREKDIEGKEHSFEDNVQLGAIFSSHGENEDCSIRCVRYTLPIKFNRAQCVSRYGDATKLTNQTLKMQVIFPEVEALSKIDQGAFYSYLPTEIRMNVPIACHVPFKLDASREYVDSQHNNQWFTYCCSEFSRLMRSAYRHYAQKYTLPAKKYNDVVYFLPSLNESLFSQTNELVRCLNRDEFLGKTFVQRDIFYSAVGTFLPASKLCYFQSTHPLTNPQELCSFLNISLEAVVLPESSSQKNFGIKKIESVGEKLFQRAFDLNAPTEEIFQYIDKHNLLDETSWNTLAQKITKRSISVSQLHAIFNHSNCQKAFCRKCTDQKNHLFASGIQIRFDIPTINVLSVDPLGELLEIDSFPSSLQTYFNRINNKCLLLQDGPSAFFLADNVIVLSGNTLDALSDLCNQVERQNLFGLQLKYREVSHALNSADDRLSSIEYLTLLRSLRNSQREALGTKQYNSYVNLLKDSSMNSDRFLSELLQNADDCIYPDNVVPTFSLTFDKNTVTTEYNECGFKKANVRAITAIGESTKKQLASDNSIGEKGVGFKSVFSVASRVIIHSGSFHFSLTKEKPTVPQIVSISNDQIGTGTKMILSMNQPFSSELQSPSNILQLCLCLRKLKEIKIGNVQIRINDTPTQRTIYLNGTEYIYRVIRYPFCVTDRTLLAERENHQRTIHADQEIAFYLPSKDIKHGYIYSGLSTTIGLNVPLYIDAPFELTTSREEIIKNRWNDMIWKQLRKGYLYMLESLAPSMKIRVLQYLNFDHKLSGRTESYNFNLFSSDTYNGRFSDIASNLRSIRIIPTFDKNRPLTSVREGAVLYPSLAQSLISRNQVFVLRPLFQIINTNSLEKYNGTLKAIGCPDASVEEVIRFLAAYASSNMDDDFAVPFWNYVYEQKIALLNPCAIC